MWQHATSLPAACGASAGRHCCCCMAQPRAASVPESNAGLQGLARGPWSHHCKPHHSHELAGLRAQPGAVGQRVAAPAAAGGAVAAQRLQRARLVPLFRCLLHHRRLQHLQGFWGANSDRFLGFQSLSPAALHTSLSVPRTKAGLLRERTPNNNCSPQGRNFKPNVARKTKRKNPNCTCHAGV